MANVARQMSPGTLGGRIRSATPVAAPTAAPQRARQSVPHVPFSSGDKDTAPLIGESGDYRLRYNQFLGTWYATLKTTGTTNTVGHVRVNDANIATFTLGNGVKEVSIDLTAVYAYEGDYVSVDCTAAGTGAKGLVVTGPIA